MSYPKACALAAAITMWVLPLAANAQQQLAYTVEPVQLRAGPGMDYPLVASLEHGVAVAVQGCLQDYSWCDVIAEPNRGWVNSVYIVYPYQSTYVPVSDYGASIGFGVVTFIIGNYWHDHYVARPWYQHMPRWQYKPPGVTMRPVGVFPIPAYQPRGHPRAAHNSKRPHRAGRTVGAPPPPGYRGKDQPHRAANRPTPPRGAGRPVGSPPKPTIVPFQRQLRAGGHPGRSSVEQQRATPGPLQIRGAKEPFFGRRGR